MFATFGRKIFDALVKYLRSPAVPYKSRIIALLSQLLSSPQLFSSTDGPDLTGSYCVGKTGRVVVGGPGDVSSDCCVLLLPWRCF